MDYEKRIFTFWEPRGSVPAYLRLCLETWGRNLPGYQVIVLDHANQREYIGPDTYDMAALKRLLLPMQKDAVQFAVLNRHGGVFMDADTIAIADIAPVTERLADTELILFGLHMAFFAARPGGRILSRCVAGVREKLEHLPENVNATTDLKWDFAGNSVLHAVMADLINATPLGRATGAVFTAAFAGLGKLSRRAASDNLQTTIYNKRQGFFFKTALKNYLTKLDREKHGFIPELAYGWDKRFTHREWYTRFWFESDLGVDAALRGTQTVMGLHNSWTPEWYKALSEREVLEHPCLLSRTLRHALGEA